MADSTSFPRKRDLRRRLESYARWYASRQKYEFGPGADANITGLSKNAALRIVEKAAEEDRPEKIELYMRQAEAALSCFVDHMIAAAQDLPGYAENHPGEIGEETYDRAQLKLCPCWPIC